MSNDVATLRKKRSLKCDLPSPAGTLSPPLPPCRAGRHSNGSLGVKDIQSDGDLIVVDLLCSNGCLITGRLRVCCLACNSLIQTQPHSPTQLHTVAGTLSVAFIS